MLHVLLFILKILGIILLAVLGLILAGVLLLIDKIRYLVKSGEHIFEVDEFYGENEGLVLENEEKTRLRAKITYMCRPRQPQ